jgi:hypothetical protein
MRIAITLVAVTLAYGAPTASAEQLDRKTMIEMLPCKSAALRLCDRSQGISAAALWTCGTTLAERQHELSRRCLNVLKRFGRL